MKKFLSRNIFSHFKLIFHNLQYIMKLFNWFMSITYHRMSMTPLSGLMTGSVSLKCFFGTVLSRNFFFFSKKNIKTVANFRRRIDRAPVILCNHNKFGKDTLLISREFGNVGLIGYWQGMTSSEYERLLSSLLGCCPVQFSLPCLTCDNKPSIFN